jgi:hypothetical protein
VPAGWGAIPGHEVAFSDRLPFLLTTEVTVLGASPHGFPLSPAPSQILGRKLQMTTTAKAQHTLKYTALESGLLYPSTLSAFQRIMHAKNHMGLSNWCRRPCKG